MNDKSVQFDDNIVIIEFKQTDRIVTKSIFKRLLERLAKLWKKE